MEQSTNQPPKQSPVYKFSQRGICRVEYIDNEFHFYGHKADKKAVIVQARDMPDLVAYFLTTKEKAERTYKEVQKNPQYPNEVVASCVISRVGNDEIRLEVQTYDKKVFTWLKLFCYSNGERQPRSGQVLFNDVDPQTLKEFYLSCTGSAPTLAAAAAAPLMEAAKA
jgi:hypothetical protein